MPGDFSEIRVSSVMVEAIAGAPPELRLGWPFGFVVRLVAISCATSP